MIAPTTTETENGWWALIVMDNTVNGYPNCPWEWWWQQLADAGCWCPSPLSSHSHSCQASSPLCTIIFCCIITLQYTIIMLIQPLINSSGSLGANSIRSTPLQNPSVLVCSFQLLSVGVPSLPLLFLCPLPYVILQAFTFSCCLLSTLTFSVNLKSFSQQELV